MRPIGTPVAKARRPTIKSFTGPGGSFGGMAETPAGHHGASGGEYEKAPPSRHQG